MSQPAINGDQRMPRFDEEATMREAGESASTPITMFLHHKEF